MSLNCFLVGCLHGLIFFGGMVAIVGVCALAAWGISELVDRFDETIGLGIAGAGLLLLVVLGAGIYEALHCSR